MNMSIIFKRRNPLLLLVFFLLITPFAFGQQLNLATYNMRNDNANNGDSARGNGWKQRLPVIAQLVRFHDFDIFGTQECLFHQLKNLETALPDYTYTGIGRDDGKTGGEFSAIFYKKNKFKLLRHGDFWLSEITDKPNKGWDAVLPRICSWGAFQDKATGFKFYFFNLHMDHIGVVARRNSAGLVLQKIKQLAGNAPVILTGDFNVDQTSDSYAVINNSGTLKDAYLLSPVKYALNGTFNDFNPNNKTDSRIDHIFLSKDFKVKRYGILTDSYRSQKAGGSEKETSANAPKEVALQNYQARLPSDHFPVMVVAGY
ncbi:endonuclease/exonuclease/phosphatase family protein [Mucilaginibacter sp.]|uniref:endonuclease/exonuclease/phosphatase family protein n=1 Tax=Mucilaginibacter sp. TaxID=1882438 RepID=UPI003B002205